MPLQSQVHGRQSEVGQKMLSIPAMTEPTGFMWTQSRVFARAQNSSEIARELGITQPMPRNHLHSINQKLRTHNRLEAVMHAMQRGRI